MKKLCEMVELMLKTFYTNSEAVSGLCILSLAVLVVVWFVAATVGDGKINNCWTRSSESCGKTSFSLYGNKNWAIDDVELGQFDTFEEAVAAAKTIKCPIDIQ